MAKKVLLADDDSLVARMVQRILQKAGYVVDVVGDGKTARDRLAHGGYDALITDWMMPELDGIELARYARTLERRPYVALLSGLAIPAAVAHAKQAGAHEFFPKPLTGTRLVDAMAAWFEKEDREGGSRIALAALGTATEADHPLAKTDAWKNLPSTIRQALADSLQTKLEDAFPWERASDDAVISVIPLTDAEHQMELHVAIEAPLAAAAEMARCMLGEVDSEDRGGIADVIAELANIAAGIAKSALGKEAFHFTLGLPNKEAISADDYALVTAVGARAGGFEVVARFGVRPRPAKRVSGAQLLEGMVLAENACNDAGMLLLPAGTRLTATATARLRSLMKARTVLVCMPQLAAA